MDKRHIIEDAEFDISFDSVAAAREHEPGLAAFIRERLLPMADEIFCELSDDGMVARIDRLEIDLGAIRCSGFHDEMESRFREKLRSLLLEKMQSLATAHSPLEGLVGRLQAERGQLETYLETGRMPWHAERTTGGFADAMLAQTLQHQGAAFAEFLKRTPHRDSVVKRLARQFPDRLLVDVMQLLAPAHATLTGELIAKLGETWKKTSAGITEKELKSLVWERLLGEHLKAGVSDPVRLLRDIVKELFVIHARPGDISGRSPGSEPARSADDFMYEPHDAADRRGEAPLAARQPEEGREWGADIIRLRALLETAFGTGDAGALSGQWEALRETHRELVRTVFMQRMGDDRLQQKVAEGFPENLLADLLDILSPQDSGFMVALSGLPELRGTGSAKNPEFWRYTLGCLHGSPTVERAAYARGLLRHMSVQGVVRRQLAQALAGIAPELKEALADLPEAFATGAEKHVEEPARAGELYRQLVQRLEGASGGEQQFIAMLKELESTYPEMQEHLLRKLQNGEIGADIGALAMSEVRQLVVSLIRLNPGSQELLRAIGSQEHLVQDTEGYYRHILDRLVRSQVVDLEAAAADEGAREGMQAAAKAEAALGRSLSERQEVRASVREEIARTIEAERADALYHRLEQRLGGTHDGQDLVPAIKRLASTHPETLARLQRRLQAGELRADVGALDGREARQLVISLIRLNSGAKESDFLRAIERYAGRAKSEAGYFRHILGNLIRNRTIDLEEAVRSHATDAHREPTHAAREDAGIDGGDRFVPRHDDREKAGAEPALESAGLLRIRLEEALALGRAGRVEGVWGELLSGHADMLREVFMHRLGDETMRTRLASGFPESMLHELVRALSPQAGRDIEMLAAQPGLRASGTPDAKNIPFWEYTLSYLHACGLRGYERSGYAQGLVHHLAEQGVSQATMQQAIARIAPVGDATLSGMESGTAPKPVDDRQDAEDVSAVTARDGEPVRQLLRRLTGVGSSRELAQDIAELADGRQEAVREFYRQLKSGDVALDVTVLTAREARLLIAAFIAANHGGMGEDIRREIEAHAGKARDERRYYQTVLEMLVSNRVLDIEEAMTALPAATAGREIHPVQAGAGEQTASTSLRDRFESALMQGDAGEIAGVWNELRFNYGNMVRDVFNLRMGDDVLRRRLAERFPEAMLFELISVLAPLAGGFIESLERQLGLQAGAAKSEAVRRAAREHALFYLHAFGARGFRRADYARDLMHRMAAQGMDGNAFLRALKVVDPALAQSLRGTAPMDVEAVAIDKQRAPAGRLRALLETAFATGDAGVLSGQWEELRDTDRELVRAVFMQCMGDDRLQQKVADGFPETMLLELLNLLSPQDSGFMIALSGLPELRGAGSAKNIEFWHYTLGYLHGSPTVERAAYARGLLRHMSAQGVVRHQLAQALAGIAPELKEALADLPEASATGAADIAQEPARAGELYRQLVQRLGGAGGGEPQFIAMLKELESTYPETQARLLRELQCGEIGADIGALAMSEARQLVISLIRLNPGAQDLLRAIGSQEHLVKDTEGYYRHILDKLLRSQAVDLEAAVDEAAQGNESTRQKARPVRGGDAFHDEEAAQARDAACAPDEAAIPARTAHLRTLLNRALLTGNAGELAGAWDELRQYYPAIVRECFERLMGDAGAQGRVVQGFPAGMQAELVRILAPAESRFIETLAAQLQAGQAAGGECRFLWQHTLGYLHATRAFDRRDFVDGLMSCLGEQGASRADILQAVAHADAALGKALSERQGMHAGTQEEIARVAKIEMSAVEMSAVETGAVETGAVEMSAVETGAVETGAVETNAVETERADELYRRVTKCLLGASGGEPEFAALVEEMASACPERLAHLLRQLQSGELRADVGALDAREARQLVTSLIRQNSGVKESDFLRAIERYAGRAKSEAGYYRHVLESLIRNRNIDLEEAASVLPQETARQLSAADRSEENRASPGAESGDEQRPQMAEDVRPLATTGDKAMQVENASAFDGHGAMDDSESAEEIYIANAGMVLATPYLPQLFRMLDLTEGTKFRDERAAERAIHLLQFMVNESCDSPEFLLSLNKLLCGVPTGVPIVREIELLQREKEAIEGMLNGIIRNWTILGNTSVQGLRESFMQRSGRLQLKEDNWHLKVESKGIDVLLDRLPWSFALIKHPWMRRPIYVEWR